MEINNLLTTDNIIFLKANNQSDALSTLTEKAFSLGLVRDHVEFKEAIFSREKLISTGIGYQIALPHAKIPSVPEFFILVAILENEIDWQALDNKPVRLIFMIGGPEDSQRDYLQILAQLMGIISNKERRDMLFTASSRESFLKVLKG